MRGISAVIALLLSGSALAACQGPGDIGPQLDVAEELIDVLELTDAERPTEVESKTVRYAATSGLAKGDVETLTELIGERLQQTGWSMMRVESEDTSGTPAQEGGHVIASRNGLVARAAIFDQIGINPAPEGSSWVQVQVATVEDDLAWTKRP